MLQKSEVEHIENLVADLVNFFKPDGEEFGKWAHNVYEYILMAAKSLATSNYKSRLNVLTRGDFKFFKEMIEKRGKGLVKPPRAAGTDRYEIYEIMTDFMEKIEEDFVDEILNAKEVAENSFKEIILLNRKIKRLEDMRMKKGVDQTKLEELIGKTKGRLKEEMPKSKEPLKKALEKMTELYNSDENNPGIIQYIHNRIGLIYEAMLGARGEISLGAIIELFKTHTTLVFKTRARRKMYAKVKKVKISV